MMSIAARRGALSSCLQSTKHPLNASVFASRLVKDVLPAHSAQGKVAAGSPLLYPVLAFSLQSMLPMCILSFVVQCSVLYNLHVYNVMSDKLRSELISLFFFTTIV